MVALDGLIDNGWHTLGFGAPEKNVTTPTLHATINWDNPEAYSSPGAPPTPGRITGTTPGGYSSRGPPPNGADSARTRDAAGNTVKGNQITSLASQGASTLPTRAVQWTVDANPPLATGDPALYSGAAN